MAAIQSIGKLFLELGLNETIWYQLGLFLASWAVLQQLVFKPYLAAQHHRHEKTTGLKEKAIADRERALKLQSEYEEFLRVERKNISTWTDEQRNKIADEERQIIQRARNAASEELQAVRTRTQSELDKARRELMPQVREYSSQIVSRLVGYKVSVPLTQSEGKKGPDIEPTVIS